MIYKPDHFIIEELVSPAVAAFRGEKAWELLDPKMTFTWDEVRKRTGRSCTMNNWNFGGKFQGRGLRTFSYYKDGKDHFSQHILGCAGDGDVYEMTPEEVIHYIVSEKKKGSFQYLTGIEVGCEWVHLDTRPTTCLDKNGLLFFDKNGIVDWETYVWPL